MRNSQLNRIDDWDDRNLFRKRRRWIGHLWILGIIMLAAALYLQREQIPDLLLGGFKVIAHTVPQEHPLPLTIADD